MLTYIVRRLLIMIPTLFGVTVVSFCVMQLAPGDPLESKLGGGGTQASVQTREAYLIQKRDLKLDRPLLLNTRYFRDYSQFIRYAAHLRALDTEQVADELTSIADGTASDEATSRLEFIKSLDIDDFDGRLNPQELTDSQLKASDLTREQWEQRKRETRVSLAAAVEGKLQIWLEDTGLHGVPAAIQLLEQDDTPLNEQRGAINCLAAMVVNPFVYTYSRRPTVREIQQVPATWELLWEQRKSRYEPVDPDRRKVLDRTLESLLEMSRAEMFEFLQSGELFDTDCPFFAELVLSDSSLREKQVAAEFLRLFLSARLSVNVPVDADTDEVQATRQNWLTFYRATAADYQHSFLAKVGGMLADTQYAHMVWRLVTFDFGRSTRKTRDPVSEKIWEAFVVTAPLVLMAQLVIYCVAIPLGVVCAVKRASPLDRGITVTLFFLYSVPPFVAAMSFLLFFCYGGYVKWFPTERLHSAGAEQLSFAAYTLDYFHHAFLPVVCLSLFSLAGLAMYSRSAMLDVLGQDYIRTARAKGLSGTKVVLKHALRNGMIPIITLFSNFLPAMLGGSVLIEVLFGIPGMGRLSFTSITLKDIPMVMALIYIQAIVVMLSILMTDLLYVFVDPRISFDRQG